MIVSKIKEKYDNINFPCLMKWKNGNYVILVCCENENHEYEGIVVYDPNNELGIGYRSNSFDKKQFIIFEGTITLRNE